jgi:hypothetical protein
LAVYVDDNSVCGYLTGPAVPAAHETVFQALPASIVPEVGPI